MREGESRSRLRLVVTTLIVVSISLITLDIRNVGVVESAKSNVADGLGTTDGFFSHLTSPFRNMWHGLTEYDDLKEENGKLRSDLQREQAKGRSELVAGTQLAQLAAMQQVRAGVTYDTVIARRTHGVGSNWDADTIYIDRGRSAGLKVGMPVVVGAPPSTTGALTYPAQLVGVIKIVRENGSVVRLISDPTLRFSVRLVQSNQRGVGHGTGVEGERIRPWLIDVGIDIDAAVPAGDVVVTSGLEDSRFPPDLPVGQVESRRTVDAENRQELSVEPWVNVGELDYVAVLKWTPEELSTGSPPPTTAAPATTTSTTAPSDGLLTPCETTPGATTGGSSTGGATSTATTVP